MTSPQLNRVARAVLFFNPTEAHHGDCIGADAEFHALIDRNFSLIVLHPPNNPIKRAFAGGDIIWAEKPYLRRNKDIVRCSNVLIAAPFEYEEILRSGTWSTVRYARRQNIPRIIIFPDGTPKVEGEIDFGSLFHRRHPLWT